MPSILDYFKDPSAIPPPKAVQRVPKPQPTQQELDAFLSVFGGRTFDSKKSGPKKEFGAKKKEKDDEVPAEVKSDRLYIFTDGSCFLNGKPNARGGWAVYFPNGEYANKAEKLTNHPTNQRCELTAIWVAIQSAEEYLGSNGKVELYTDSEYSIKCMTQWCANWKRKNWCKADGKPIENRDIIEPMFELYTKHRHNINLNHIRAHTGKKDFYSQANDVVDNMARNTISG